MKLTIKRIKLFYKESLPFRISYFKYWLASKNGDLLFNRYRAKILNKRIIIYVNPEDIRYALPWTMLVNRVVKIDNLKTPANLNIYETKRWIGRVLPIDYNTPHICNIVPGNWDLEDNLIAFEENLAYRAFREVYIEGKRWEETLYCDYFKNNYYTDEENIRRRFLYNEFLYNEIKLKGYRSKKLLDYQKSEDLHPESPIHLNDEIRIGIGRKGNLIFIDGNHRLAVVKILACDLIPVRVALAHPTFDLGTFLEHHRAMHPSPEGYS